MNFNHKSVLLNECIEALNIKEDGLYLDATVGGGGHSLEIAKRLDKGRLVCMDRDIEALLAAKHRLVDYDDKIIFIHGNFRDIKDKLMPFGLYGFDGILMDIGVSSYQIDNEERGFSFLNNGPLDMRMDQNQKVRASDIVNAFDEDRLYRIFKDYGEERYARRIANKIVNHRISSPYQTCDELVRTIISALPEEARKEELKSVMRIFQALRIEVNDELGSLKDTIPEMISLLKKGGRLAVISFHSLEDRMVKLAFKEAEKDCICPPKLPVCACNKKAIGKQITKKPIIAKKQELLNNPRAHSAKLRVLEKIGG